MDSQNQKGSDLVESRRQYIERLEAKYPFIPWKEPVHMNDMEGNEGFGCRICIAEKGIKAEEIKDLPRSVTAHARHMKEYHFVNL